jgi:hypothetical protein
MAPRWIVSCPKCQGEFTHTNIQAMATGVGTRDLFVSPPKPQIPESGTKLECHHCGKTSIYRALDLRFRAD